MKCGLKLVRSTHKNVIARSLRKLLQFRNYLQKDYISIYAATFVKTS